MELASLTAPGLAANNVYASFTTSPAILRRSDTSLPFFPERPIPTNCDSSMCMFFFPDECLVPPLIGRLSGLRYWNLLYWLGWLYRLLFCVSPPLLNLQIAVDYSYRPFCAARTTCIPYKAGQEICDQNTGGCVFWQVSQLCFIGIIFTD